MKIKRQIRGLHIFSALGNLSLTGAWVTLLAARGFSLVEIGLAETAFHITSLLCEIPSGILADVFGRKRMLIVSTIAQMIGDLIMMLSNSFAMVCVSLCVFALKYNFASGSDTALAYDSLKMVGQEDGYERYESRQLVLYRICSGISTLCAGIALAVGYQIAYGISAAMGILQLLSLIPVREVYAGGSKRAGSTVRSAVRESMACFRESIQFLWSARKAVGLMMCNALVGAADILLLFFLQAKLPESSIPGWALGIALLCLELGGIIGSRLIIKLPKLPYRWVFIGALSMITLGYLAEHTMLYAVMTIGGMLASAGDDALQVRTNAKLQSMFPSEQRATLTSVESFAFSIVMIVLSPLAGVLFTHW